MTTSLPPWLLETWIEYAISVAIALARLVLRTRLLGFRGWQGDDYLVIIAIIFFTVDVACFQVIHRLGTNIGLTTEALSTMTSAEIANIRTGSIINQLSWYTWSGHLWACKGCMLFLYCRLTMRLWQKKMVVFTSWVVGLTFVGGYLVNTFKCWPVQKNWQVTPPPGDCPAGAANLFFTGITNFITDILILSIPVPILHVVNLPFKKKLMMSVIFGSGVLIVIVSLLRFIFSILAIYGIGPEDLGFRLGWTARENSTSLIIVNVPIIFSTIQRLGRPSQRSSSASGLGSRATHPSRSRSGFHSKGTIELTTTRVTTGGLSCKVNQDERNRTDSYIMIHENHSMGDEEKASVSSNRRL